MHAKCSHSVGLFYILSTGSMTATHINLFNSRNSGKQILSSVWRNFQGKKLYSVDKAFEELDNMW